MRQPRGYPFLGAGLVTLSKPRRLRYRVGIVEHSEFCGRIHRPTFNVIINEGTSRTQAEMVTFKDQNPAYVYEVASSMDETRKATDNNDADLGNFFARPIKIDEVSWGTGTTLFKRINPWALYFQNLHVNNRIANFKNLRCKLHVKVIINGNGFHFGRAIMAYTPLHNFDNFGVARNGISQDVIRLSQRPHIYLDPTVNQGGELVLPFFWYHNNLSIPDEEYTELGVLDLASMQSLKHANGASDLVTISVYAWASELEMSIPTSISPGEVVPEAVKRKYTPQAGDEYGQGIISKPASTVARIAGALTDIPVIGPYARATELGASGIAAGASALGYCKPNTLDATVPFRPNAMGNMANTNVSDNTTKLTLDAKQEITIDPRTTGIGGDDEMSIASIARRESYLTSFTWPIGINPEVQLFYTAVTPTLWDFVPTDQEPEIHLPALAYATMPFRFWRGTLKFRFQIVASNYHKGRLKIVYDPHYLLAGAVEYNTNYTHVVDISEEKDFTIEIGWGSDRPFCQTFLPGRNANITIPPHGTNPLNIPLDGRLLNGMLGVYVVNTLTTPNSAADNDIGVNVFVSAGDDFQVREPSECLEWYSWKPSPEEIVEPPPTGGGGTCPCPSPETHVPLKTAYGRKYIPQSADEALVDAENTAEPSKPMDQHVEETMANKLSSTDAYDHVFFGESIVSFRSMLKRFQYHHPLVFTSGNETTTGPGKLRWNSYSFPFYRGYVPGGLDTVTKGDYNYGMMTLMNWLTPAYTGWRGGIRWKVNATFFSDLPYSVGDMAVIRLPEDTSGYNLSVFALGAFGDAFDKSMCVTKDWSTASGAIATNFNVNPTLEWEMPFAQAKRFLPCGRINHTSSQIDEFRSTAQSLTFTYGRKGPTTFSGKTYVAAGEDFSLFFYTGPPVLYYNLAIPV